eukprot:Gb_24055 [translate_table: standard]
MTKHKGFSKIMIRDVVRMEDKPLAYEIMRLRNLNIFLYENIMRLRIENKSLVERMDQIRSIAKNKSKVRRREKHKPQGWSLWKCLSTPHEGGVLEKKCLKRMELGDGSSMNINKLNAKRCELCCVVRGTALWELEWASKTFSLEGCKSEG